MKTINFERNENKITFTLAISENEFNDNFAVCHDCGSVVPIDSALEYNGEYFCEDCTTTCFSCGEIIPNRYARDVYDSSALYCEYCWEEETYVCNDCHGHFRYADSVSEGNDGEYYCENCIDDHTGSCLDEYHTMKNTSLLVQHIMSKVGGMNSVKKSCLLF